MSTPGRLIQWFPAAALIILAFGGGIGLSWWQSQHADPDTVEGLLWPDPRTVLPFHLISADGSAYTVDRMRGRWTMLFFGFTHCPDVCPTTLETMARAFDQISERTPTLAANLDMRLISVDPERDSPEALNQYVQYFHPRLNAATGSEVELESFAAQLGALFLRVETGNDYTMDHSAGIFIVDPELRLVSVVTPPHNAPAITNRLINVESFISSLQ